MVIRAPGPGRLVEFEADVVAQYVTPDTDKSITGLQTVTVGANPSDITTARVNWAGISQINIAAAGLANWYPDEWSLTIDNHLKAHLGTRVGADSNKYQVAIGLDEGPTDIIFECKLPLENETYTNAKLAGSVITALTLPVDNKTVTLSTGYFEANDLPTLQHDILSQSIKARFKSLSIA